MVGVPPNDYPYEPLRGILIYIIKNNYMLFKLLRLRVVIFVYVCLIRNAQTTLNLRYTVGVCVP